MSATREVRYADDIELGPDDLRRIELCAQAVIEADMFLSLYELPKE